MNLQLEADRLSGNLFIIEWVIAAVLVGQLSNRGSCKECDPRDSCKLLAGEKCEHMLT